MTARRDAGGQGRGIMAAIHETAVALWQAGVMDRRTLREFDVACQAAEISGGADAGAAKATRHRSRKKAP